MWRIHEHQWAYSRVYNRLSKYVDLPYLTDEDCTQLQEDINTLIAELYKEGLPLRVSDKIQEMVMECTTQWEIDKNTGHVDKESWTITMIVAK